MEEEEKEGEGEGEEVNVEAHAISNDGSIKEGKQRQEGIAEEGARI